MSKLQWSDLKDNMSIRKTSARSSLNARLTQASLINAKGISSAVSGAPSFATVVASGGTQSNLSINGTNYRVHTFATSANLVVTTGGNVDLLVVGAGGAARGWNLSVVSCSGGGGGGGVLLYGDYEQSRAGGPPIVLAPGTTYTATIAAGGAGTANSYSGPLALSSAGNGGNTKFAGGSIDLTAYGGEMGMVLIGNSAQLWAGNSAMSVAGQSFYGGHSSVVQTTAYQAGGGGGAGGNGQSSFNTPANFRYWGGGGAGIVSSITGTKTSYGGGGNGGWYNWAGTSPGSPGELIRGSPIDGGGTAGIDQFTANASASGNVNSGGGGGGGTTKSTTVATRSSIGGGGSGIVIVRYIV
jgi:hypothetical protein